MRDDSKPAEPREMEFLEDDPVTDDVLDEVRSHHSGREDEEDPEAGMRQCAGWLLSGGGAGRRQSVDFGEWSAG